MTNKELLMSKAPRPQPIHPASFHVPAACEFIRRMQKPSGEIPWSKGGKTDVWDHVESAMGLTTGGFYSEARNAYTWAAGTQLADGSWWSYYQDGIPAGDAYKDSNMTAYIAVGVLHYYLSTADASFVLQMWPTVRRAMGFVIGMQGREGEIYWAKRRNGTRDKRGLLTGSSSIYKSLWSALCLAALVEEDQPHWLGCFHRLGRAIRSKPHAFDQSKSRYAMDWYYPVLSGAVTGAAAAARIEAGWSRFVIPEWGVRCVSDRPWVTVAETAELVIALTAMGRLKAAENVFSWIPEKQDDDGAFWTGVTSPDRTVYPMEKTAWTAAAVLIANDVLYGCSPAGRLFDHGPILFRPLFDSTLAFW
jgi:hypothetical protein